MHWLSRVPMYTFKSYPNEFSKKILLGVIWKPRNLWKIILLEMFLNVLVKVAVRELT